MCHFDQPRVISGTLAARDLSFAYPGGAPAVAGLSLSIAPGEKLALLGANGAGKSTLLLLLNGSLRPARGAVLLDGTPLSYDRKALTALRRRVGLVFQDPDDQLFAATVFEDVSFGPMNVDLPEAEARHLTQDALELMGIAALAARPTHMLSFGQRKRVALAGVLAMQPDYLLLDEPTAGLDPTGADALMAALEAVSARGAAVVIATHDMDLAYAWADRIIVFGGGTVALDGPPAHLLSHGDALAPLGLKPPLLLELFRTLKASGLIPADARVPRTRAALQAMLAG